MLPEKETPVVRQPGAGLETIHLDLNGSPVTGQ
jgi:hypothetical protein